jgi:hypothetical protein
LHYFGLTVLAVLAGVALFFGAFLCTLGVFLLVAATVVLLAGTELVLLAGGFTAGFVWAANVRGIVATASAIASKLFFIFFSPWRAVLPAHKSILRLLARNIDSLRRL